MSKLLESLKSIVGWPYTVLVGMGVTQKYFNRKAVTIHYPQQKRKVYDAWRGILAMAVDEKGAPKCISCGLCERICPTKSITLKTEQPEGSKKKVLVGFEVDHLTCIFCGMCEEICPVGAIFLTEAYDLTSYEPEDLVYDLPRLIAQGKRPDQAVEKL